MTTLDSHGGITEAITCPFKVGDRVRQRDLTHIASSNLSPVATIDSITDEGFRYTWEEPQRHGRTADGQWTTGGTVFPTGYDLWELVGCMFTINSDSSRYLLKSSSYPVMTLSPSPASFALRIHGTDGEPLVSIAYDGTVEVHKEGAEPAAARAFYEALQFHGQSLVARVKELEEQLLEARLTKYEAA